jgi:hypothetical protein
VIPAGIVTEPEEVIVCCKVNPAIGLFVVGPLAGVGNTDNPITLSPLR